jgi:hypothetical protein
MKKIFKSLVLFGALALVTTFAGCKKDEVGKTFVVSFNTGVGGSSVPTQEVKQGKKVTKPADPTNTNNDEFVAWQEGSRDWNFDIDIVSKDLTLDAKWRELSNFPVDVTLASVPFSNTLQWYQQGSSTVNHSVYLKNATGGEYVLHEGVRSIVENTSGNDLVKYTLSNVQGGSYYVKILSNQHETELSETVLFKGKGLETNPYLVENSVDLYAILDGTYLTGYFKQIANLENTSSDPIIISEQRVNFAGQYDGNNNSIIFQGNSGLFHTITETAVVKNLTITGTIVGTYQDYAVGALSDVNLGLIDNVKSSSAVSDEKLQGTLEANPALISQSDNSTGAGSIVGVNGLTGRILNSSVSGAGAVKAGRGTGGIAAYNYGLIERVSVSATLPAGNQANSGKSSQTYSFGGGVVGYNYGTINQVSVTGRVFAQSAYSTSGDGNEGKNIAFGGIAGYNSGTINEVSFSRSLSSKEFISKSRATELNDVANNLGVASIHGDIYVGGLVGINAGTINNSYVGGAIVGGRDFVGGIAGKVEAGSNITTSYAFAEVAIKDDDGKLVTSANAKTTLTTYSVAPSAASSTLKKDLVNSVKQSAWKSGDIELPSLPTLSGAEIELINTNNKFADSGILKWQQGGVTGVSINPQGGNISVFQTISLTAEVSPASAPDKFVSWEIADTTVLELLGDGVFKGLKVGSTTVTATTRDGGFTDTVTIVVGDYNKVTQVSITSPDYTLPEQNNVDRPEIEQGTTFHLLVTVGPEEAELKGFTISSSNGRATVSEYDAIQGALVTITKPYATTGNVQIDVAFEDPSVATVSYKFKTIETPVIPTEKVVTITSSDVTLPEANGAAATKVQIPSANFTVKVTIEGYDGTDTISATSSVTSRATVVAGDFAAGVSIVNVTYLNVGNFTLTIIVNSVTYAYRFEFISEPTPIEKVVTITSDDVTLPEANGGAATKVQIPSANFTVKVTIEGYDGTDTISATSSASSRATAVAGDFAAGVSIVNVTYLNVGNFTLTIVVNSVTYAYRFEFVA